MKKTKTPPKLGPFRVFASCPMDLHAARDLSGMIYWRSQGWFWLTRSGDPSLWIRVRGLDNARWVARSLNEVEKAGREGFKVWVRKWQDLMQGLDWPEQKADHAPKPRKGARR